MRRSIGWSIALLLAGCSGRPQEIQAGQGQQLAMSDVNPEAAPEPSAPQIAYSYALSYALPTSAVGTVQASHVALCRKLGPARCRIVKTSLQRAATALDDTTAETDLLIDARLAGGFGSQLDAAATDASGTVANRTVTAEDVTKQLIDTDARVRAKQALANRLLQLINSTNAKVGDLVAAEKAFADAQEELDAARSLQATLGQRVRMSAVDISYRTTGATGSWAPVRRSLAGMVETLATSIGALVTFVVAALPWALLLAGVIWLLRRLRWRPPLPRFRRGTVANRPAD